MILDEDEVSNEYLEGVYQDIRSAEIQLKPLPQAPLSSLPVAPDIEGWLVLILPRATSSGQPGVQLQRYW